MNGTATLQIIISNLWKLLFLFCRKYILRTSLAGFWPVPRGFSPAGLMVRHPQPRQLYKAWDRRLAGWRQSGRYLAWSRDPTADQSADAVLLFCFYRARARVCVARVCRFVNESRVISFLFCCFGFQLPFLFDSSSRTNSLRMRNFRLCALWSMAWFSFFVPVYCRLIYCG